ncbi:MAG TPA: hypothetical protein PKL45_15380 [Bacteroidia bacterium]|nr:hypothetical protein [Bacteroidia bacterium]
MTTNEFIDKWNVAYENLEQKLEFAAEMTADLKSIKGYTEEDMESFASWVSLGYSIEPEKSNGERGLVYYENGTFDYHTGHTKLYTMKELLNIWKEANE